MGDQWSLKAAYKRALPFLGSMKITSPFGARWWKTGETYVQKMHYGMDIVGTSDKTVVSVSTGTVKATSSKTGFGNHVWVWNEDGTTCVYAHLASISCKTGDKVNAKSTIGIMGSTGHSTGPHLHIGVFDGHVLKEDHDKAFDPAMYLHIEGSGKDSDKWLNGSGYIPLNSGMQTYSSMQSMDQGEEEEYTYYPSVVETTYNDGSENTPSNIEFSGSYYQIVPGSTQYLDTLYGRRYRILIASKDGTALDVSNLRCTFKLTRSWTNFSELSTVSIYNLSVEHENRIISDADTVYIEAGYAGKATYGIIYKGSIIQALREKQSGTDYILTLLLANSSQFNNYSVLGVTVNSQANMRRVISEVATKAGNLTNTNYGMSLGKITDRSDNIKLPRGKVLFGKSSKILEQISTSLGSTLNVEDGKINIISPDLISSNTIFSIGPDSGLIGTPEQVENGVSLKTLLNPQFDLNSLFHIDNTIIKTLAYNLGSSYVPLDSQGIYRVIKIVHEGDTRGNEWFTNITALSQIGSLPTAALDINSNLR